MNQKTTNFKHQKSEFENRTPYETSPKISQCQAEGEIANGPNPMENGNMPIDTLYKLINQFCLLKKKGTTG